MFKDQEIHGFLFKGWKMEYSYDGKSDKSFKIKLNWRYATSADMNLNSVLIL